MSPTNDLPPTVSLRKKRHLGKIHLTCFWSSTDYKLIKSAEFNYVIALDLKSNSDWLFHYSKSSVLRDCTRAYVIHSVWHFYLNFNEFSIWRVFCSCRYEGTLYWSFCFLFLGFNFGLVSYNCHQRCLQKRNDSSWFPILSLPHHFLSASG